MTVESSVSRAAMARLSVQPWCVVIVLLPQWDQKMKVRHIALKRAEFEKKCTEGPCALLWRNNGGQFRVKSHGGRPGLQPFIAGINGQGDYSGVLYPSGRRLEDEHKTPAAKSKRSRDMLPSAFSPAQKVFRGMMDVAGAIYVAGYDADSIERAVEVAVFATQFEPVAVLTREQEMSRQARLRGWDYDSIRHEVR